MEELKKLGGFFVRVGVWSTLIAMFWTGMVLYWSRDDPDRSTTGLILVFAVVWVCSLPFTIGTEIALFILRRLREKSALQPTGVTAHGEQGPGSGEAKLVSSPKETR